MLDLVLYYRKASTSASQQGAAIIPHYGSGGIRASGVGNKAPSSHYITILPPKTKTKYNLNSNKSRYTLQQNEISGLREGSSFLELD